MQTVSHSIDEVMAEYLTDKKLVFQHDITDTNIFKSGEGELFDSTKIYGTMMLHPVLKCVENCLNDKKNINWVKDSSMPISMPISMTDQNEALSNTVMAATTASASVDYDTSYGSRGFLTKTYGNYGWINDFTLQTLIDNKVAYVEIANSISKVSFSMSRNEQNEKILAMEATAAACKAAAVNGVVTGTACADTPGCRKQTKLEVAAFKKLKSTIKKYPNAKKVPKQCVPKEDDAAKKLESCTKCGDTIIVDGESTDPKPDACKGCEFTVFNGKIRISMYGHKTVVQQQNFVNTKWLMMVCCDTSARFDKLPTTAFIFFHLDNIFFISSLCFLSF